MNMELLCLIIDDQLFAAEHIRDLMRKVHGLKFIGIETDPIVARDKILSGELKPDIVFLDISMKKLNGIKLADEIKDLAAVIFTTAHPHHEAEAFKVDAIDYLLKPIEYPRFLKCINKVKRLLALSHKAKAKPLKDYLFIPGYTKGTKISIDKNEILYVQSALNYVYIYTSEQKFIKHTAIKKMVAELGSNTFKRVHKSYIVNVAKVGRIAGNIVYLKNKTEVALGPTYRKELIDFISSDTVFPASEL
jgi:DNA-binding LytR/AlgR family response regulator